MALLGLFLGRQQSLGGLGEFELVRRIEFHPVKMVGEGPVVEVEIPLALDQDGPGSDVEIVQGIDQSPAQGPLQLQESGG